MGSQWRKSLARRLPSFKEGSFAYNQSMVLGRNAVVTSIPAEASAQLRTGFRQLQLRSHPEFKRAKELTAKSPALNETLA